MVTSYFVDVVREKYDGSIYGGLSSKPVLSDPEVPAGNQARPGCLGKKHGILKQGTWRGRREVFPPIRCQVLAGRNDRFMLICRCCAMHDVRSTTSSKRCFPIQLIPLCIYVTVFRLMFPIFLLPPSLFVASPGLYSEARS